MFPQTLGFIFVHGGRPMFKWSIWEDFFISIGQQESDNRWKVKRHVEGWFESMIFFLVVKGLQGGW